MSEHYYQLRVLTGPRTGEVIPLDSVTMTIGRDPMSEITINDSEVSRQHARLAASLSGYTIQDLGSTNGTTVDGKRLGGTLVELEIGQRITVGGNVSLEFQSIVPAEEELATMLDLNPGELAAGAGLGEQEGADEDDQSSHDAPEDPSIDSDTEAQESVQVEPVAVAALFESEVDDSQMTELEEEEEELDSHPPQMVTVEHAAEDNIPDEAPAESPIEEMAGTDLQPLAEEEASAGALPLAEREQEPIEPIDAKAPKQGMGRVMTALVGLLLILICICCGSALFMYNYGGDWVLRQLGILP